MHLFLNGIIHCEFFLTVINYSQSGSETDCQSDDDEYVPDESYDSPSDTDSISPTAKKPKTQTERNEATISPTSNSSTNVPLKSNPSTNGPSKSDLSKIERSNKSILLTKETVTKRIKDKTYTFQAAVKRKLKNSSPAWRHIQIVLDENRNAIDGFYYCLNCSNVVINDTKSTTPFNRHLDSCIAPEKQVSITQYATKSTRAENGVAAADTAQNAVKISMQHRQNLKNGMCEFVCHDLRPFVGVEGRGFVAAMCTSFELGKANPNLSLSDFHKILPGRTTVQKQIESNVDLAKKKSQIKTTTRLSNIWWFFLYV